MPPGQKLDCVWMYGYNGLTSRDNLEPAVRSAKHVFGRPSRDDPQFVSLAWQVNGLLVFTVAAVGVVYDTAKHVSRHENNSGPQSREQSCTNPSVSFRLSGAFAH